MPTKNKLTDILKPWLANVAKLKENADQIFIDPKAEEVLIQLLEAQKQVADAIDQAKKKLEEKALKLNPNFSSIQADKVKVFYRSYGQRYYVDEANINMAPKELYTAESKITYKIDTKALEKWVDEKGGMPTGIKEYERPKTLSFSLKNGANDEES